MDEDAKKKVCEIALRVKPAFLKTSTGKSFGGAKLEDVLLMKKILKDEVRIKAAGGIHTYEEAKALIDAGASALDVYKRQINSGVTDKYKLIIVVQTIKEAKQLVDGCPSITSINLGNTKESKTTTQVSKQVFLEEEEKAILKELMERGVECEIRALVDDNKLNVAHVLK